MTREILIDKTGGLTRAAVLEDEKLCELYSELDKAQRLTESIFYGKVMQISKSLNAAFVDIGQPLNAFLPLENGRTLRCGDFMIVQGADKKATDTKGLRITEKINLAGKWLVLIPGGSGVHISKKIKDEETRTLLLEAAEAICPEGFGLIVRTATEEVSEAVLAGETEVLLNTWRSVQQKAAGMVRPGLLHGQLSLPERIVRDLGGAQLARVVVSDGRIRDLLAEKQKLGELPESTSIVLFEARTQLLFDAFGVEKEAEKALNKRVWLPCGGYLIIDRCEAMTVIDVNSGKMSLGRGIEETAFRVNLESADEIARQLRLRDIGGIVVIDFIDMKDVVHREKLLARLKAACRNDRARVIVEGVTRLGLVELTRHHMGEELYKTMHASCPYCGGEGEILSPMETAGRAMRQLLRMRIAGQEGAFVVKAAPAVTDALSQIGLPEDWSAQVFLLAVSGKHAARYEIEQIGIHAEPPKGACMLNRRNEHEKN